MSTAKAASSRWVFVVFGCLVVINNYNTWDFQQFDILTYVDSDEPLQPPFKLRNSKWCSVSNLTIIECSSDVQRLWSDCAYAQADLRLCWSHIPNCWKSHVLAQLSNDHCITKVHRKISVPCRILIVMTTKTSSASETTSFYNISCIYCAKFF